MIIKQKLKAGISTNLEKLGGLIPSNEETEE
jgi:hypothetical protein